MKSEKGAGNQDMESEAGAGVGEVWLTAETENFKVQSDVNLQKVDCKECSKRGRASESMLARL